MAVAGRSGTVGPTGPSRPAAARPSTDALASLLARHGYHLEAGVGRERVLYLQVGKWLVSVSALGRCLASRHFGLRQLARASLVSTYRSPGTPRADLILLRDKETKKASFFDLTRAAKTVVWMSPEDLGRELEAIREFEARGVATPPVLAVDESICALTQRLVGRPFQSHGTLQHVRTVLRRSALGAAKGAPVRYWSAGLGGEPHSAVPREFHALCGLTARELAAAVGWGDEARHSLVLCHGDLSVFNVLVGDGGGPFLIDFDRSFLASPAYDAVFLHLTDGRYATAQLAEDLAHVANSGPGGSEMDDAPARYAVALASFIVDNLRYLHERVRPGRLGAGRAARFTAQLLSKAVGEGRTWLARRAA